MALEPAVCESLGICRPCACDSFTQWRLTFDDESRSSETRLSGHDESNLVFYEIVGDMVFGRRARVRPDTHISHMALSHGPATSGKEFRDYPSSCGDTTQRANRQKQQNDSSDKSRPS